MSVERAAAFSNATQLWQQLVDPSYVAARLDEPDSEEPVCDDADRCRWRMAITWGPDGSRGTLGHLEIDSDDGSATFVPNDGHERRWQLDAYLAYDKRARRAVQVAETWSDVKRFCRSMVDVHQLSCAIWVDQNGAERCPPAANAYDPCMWWIYVGERHPTHAVRWASLILRPPAFTVEAVADTACGPLSVNRWRTLQDARQRAASGGTPYPDCPQGISPPEIPAQ